MKASGETLARSVSNAGANKSFLGNERGYRQMYRGVQAGNKGSIYRGGLLGDAQAAQAGSHNQAKIARGMDDAQSTLDWQTAMAGEREGLMRLQFDQDQTTQNAENALRRDIAYSLLSNQQRQADSHIGGMSRVTNSFGWLQGLMS